MEACQATQIPLDCPHWSLLLCHARVQFDSTGLPSLNISILFYIHCSSNMKALFPPLPALQFEGLRFSFLVRSQAGPSPHTFRVLGDFKPVPRPLRGQRERLIETVKLPTLSVYLVFYMLWRHAGLQMDSTRLPILIVSIVFRTLWKHARLHIDPTGLPPLDTSIYFARSGAMPGYSLTPLDCPR